MRPKFLLVAALMGIGWVSMKWYLDQTCTRYIGAQKCRMNIKVNVQHVTTPHRFTHYLRHVWSQMIKWLSIMHPNARWMASSMVKIGPWQSLHQWCRNRRNRMTWICCQQWCCLMMGVLLISWERDWAQTHPVILILFGFVVFPKTFDCWTFEACLPTCSNGCFWRLFQQHACLCFCISFRMCPHPVIS